MVEISSLPDEIIQNILARLPLTKLKSVCKRWNRLLSDPYFWPRGVRKVLLPFAPKNFDVLEEENDTTRSMVTLDSSPFSDPEDLRVTFAGSCNGIVLLVINQHVRYRWLKERTHMVLYNPLTGAKKLVPDHDLRSKYDAYGFGYGSTTDDLKIVRFRDCEYKWWCTCDVFSPKTNSWNVLKNFQDAKGLKGVGMFAYGTLHWIAYEKILALDVNSMVLSDIHLPFTNRSSYEYSCLLGTLHGSLCILAEKTTPRRNQFTLWVMTAGEGGENKSWLEASSFTLNLDPEFWYHYYSPVIILDDGMILISLYNERHKKLVIYDTMKDSHKVIKISATPSWFERSHGIEYVESLVSPSSLFNS